MGEKRQRGLVIALCVLVPAIFAASQNFIPDVTFKGSSLTGWHKLGNADWRAENGEIVGTPKAEGGGWLVLDKSYQDIQVYTSFRCSGPCKSGVLLRAEKTPQGMKGVYVSLSDGDVAPYEISLDAQGNETSRNRLTPPSGQIIRMAAARSTAGEDKVPGYSTLAPSPLDPPPAPRPPAAAPPPGRGGRGGGPALKSGDWNTVQITLDADIVGVALNGGRGGTGATTDRMMGFGPIALYAGGASEVRFKEVSYKDLNPKVEPKEIISSNFQMQRISDFYYGWCAAAADINHDGVMDIVSGPFYYLGPDYTERREFTGARSYNPTNHFAQAMVNFAYDFTGDGWPDVLAVDTRPIFLYVNPRGESRRWDRFNVVPQAASEIELLKDIDGDGKPEVLFMGPGATMAYAKPDPANPTAPWITHTISEPGLGSAHGMGIGDVNGDGRMDILNSRGWWEQPAKGSTQELWTFHATPFGSGGAEMGVYDVNGDGLNDVVTALSAHGWGLAWFEQKRDKQGVISFVQRNIMGDFLTKNAGDVTFSEPHGATFADIDGDGIPDLLTGKRLYSHLESYLDPDPYGAAVLYAYRTVRNPKAEGGAEFVPELIHNRSGVGSHFIALDLNKDGAVDIVTSTTKGTFIFWGKRGAARNNGAKK